MAGRADPRGSMDVHTDVIVEPDSGLPGMDPHAYPEVQPLGPTRRGQRPLPGHRGSDRVTRAREGHEERVPLSADLPSVVLVEGHPKYTLMLGQDVGVAIAQPRQQPRRALDVREQEGDGAARELARAAHEPGAT